MDNADNSDRSWLQPGATAWKISEWRGRRSAVEVTIKSVGKAYIATEQGYRFRITDLSLVRPRPTSRASWDQPNEFLEPPGSGLAAECLAIRIAEEQLYRLRVELRKSPEMTRDYLGTARIAADVAAKIIEELEQFNQ